MLTSQFAINSNDIFQFSTTEHMKKAHRISMSSLFFFFCVCSFWLFKLYTRFSSCLFRSLLLFVLHTRSPDIVTVPCTLSFLVTHGRERHFCIRFVSRDENLISTQHHHPPRQLVGKNEWKLHFPRFFGIFKFTQHVYFKFELRKSLPRKKLQYILSK